MLDDIKVLLGIALDDTDRDELLGIMINDAGSRLLLYLSGTSSVPEALEYIVRELVVARFNTIGNEGMASYTQEGESITYEDILSRYMDDIDAWNAAQENSMKGRVRFL